MRWAIILSLILTGSAGAAPASADGPLQVARTALERARTAQRDIMQILADLDADRRRAGSIAELLNTLGAIHQMQAATVRSTRAMMARTFGKPVDALSEKDRQAIEQLAVDERAVRLRWADWLAGFTRYVTSARDAPAALGRLHARATASPAGDLMEQVVTQISANHLSQAGQTAQEAADELARLGQALEAATISPGDLMDKHIRVLREMIDREKNIRSRVEAGPATALDWRRLRRDQADVGEQARILTFPEGAIVPGSREHIQSAHQSMLEAHRHLRQRQQDQAVNAADAAIRALEQALELAETLGKKGLDTDMPAMGPIKPKRPLKFGGMMALPGEGGAGVDVSPIATLAADIALVAKLRKRQAQLYAEATGKAPAGPMPAGRQRSYAAQLPQVIRRVELYAEAVATSLEEARAAMVESAHRLASDDRQGSVPHQEVALDRLASAEAQMRQFWKELMEYMARISTVPGQVPSHGANQGEEEKAKTDMFLTLFREIVRVGRLMKDLDILIARTEGWAAARDAADPAAVAEAATRHRQLTRTGLDILENLKPLPGEVVGSLPEAVLEASQWIQGAADMLDEQNFSEALKRQRLAVEFLENAWTIMAQSMATLSEGQQADENEQKDRQGKPRMGPDDSGAVTAADKGDDGKPWYWNLPPRAREAISQSLAQPLPPEYESAIKRYYERLSNRNKGGR